MQLTLVGAHFGKECVFHAGIYWHVEVLTYLKARCVLGGGLWNITSKIKELWQAVDLLHHLATYQLAFSDTSRVLSQHEKYRKCHLVTTKLASLASESILREFNQRYELLLELMGYWQSRKMAYVVEAMYLRMFKKVYIAI